MIGLDIKRYADTLNGTHPTSIVFKRPGDTTQRVFKTYIAQDEDGNKRIRFEIILHLKSTKSSMMGSPMARRELNMVKRVHRFSHSTATEMKELFKDASLLSGGIGKACDKVHRACDICASTGRLKDKEKVSLTHVNEAFNVEIQADYVIVYIREEKFEVMNMIDLGTRYGERAIAKTPSSESMTEMLESEWIYHHGAPEKFSADSEFCRPFMQRFLTAHNIELGVVHCTLRRDSCPTRPEIAHTAATCTTGTRGLPCPPAGPHPWTRVIQPQPIRAYRGFYLVPSGLHPF